MRSDALRLPVLAALLLLPSAARAANVRTDRPRLLFANGSGPDSQATTSLTQAETQWKTVRR